MICQRCRRPMQTPAAVVQTRYTKAFFGPKCAKAMGIMPAHKTVRIKRAHVEADPAQMELIEELEAA